MLTRTMGTTAKHDGLFCELYWGTTLNEVRSFGPKQERVLAAADETVGIPLYGFTLPEEPFLMAERTAHGYRVFIPPATRVERSQRGDAFHALPASEWQHTGAQAWVDLAPEQRLRLSQGELSVLLTHSVAGKSAGLRLRDFGLLAALVAFLLTIPVGIHFAGYSPEHMAETTARALEAKARLEQLERQRLGVDTPARPLPPAQGSQADAGVKPLPGNFGVR